jgi:hypothetical protein
VIVAAFSSSGVPDEENAVSGVDTAFSRDSDWRLAESIFVNSLWRLPADRAGYPGRSP